MRWRERLADAGFAAGWAAVKALPEPLVAAGFRAAADRAGRRGGKGATRLRANLRRVVPTATDAELAALSAVTVAQRIMEVRRQAAAADRADQ